jgi:4'-phosphopantetheinyl transferase
MEPASALACSWPSPSPWPDLRGSAVHVWCIAVDTPEAESEAWRSVLSEEEREQAARMRLEHVRRRFMGRRSALRQILGRYLNARPERIRFDRGAYGKPSLAPPWNDSGIRFGATHSAGLALVALAGADLGVDAERIRPIDAYEDLSRRYFAPAEQEMIRRTAEPERLAAFFRGWARKEALMKAIGAGLSLGLDQVVVSLEAGPAPKVYSIQGSTAAAARWRLDDLEPAPGYVGALALPAGTWSIECFRWP